MCPTVYISVHLSSLADIHCSELFEISGFCDTINIESSSGPLSYPIVAQCHGDSAPFEQQDWPFHVSRPFAHDADFGVSQFRALYLCMVVAELVSLPALPYLHNQGKVFSTAPPRPPNAAISSRQGQLSSSHDPGAGPPTPNASRTSSTVLPSQGMGPTVPGAAVCEGQGQFCASHDPQDQLS